MIKAIAILLSRRTPDEGKRERYIAASTTTLEGSLRPLQGLHQDGVFQKLLKAEANRRVRMCNLQSAKDCASVKTSLATVRARAQEWGKWECGGRVIYWWVEGRLVAVVGL